MGLIDRKYDGFGLIVGRKRQFFAAHARVYFRQLQQWWLEAKRPIERILKRRSA
jgi:hypothetical protein